MSDQIRKLAYATVDLLSTPKAFLVALCSVLFWFVTGPLFKFSDTWQLVINTSTTIVTFLIGFLILISQARGDKITQAKLDELILTKKNAHNDVAALEDKTDEELQAIRQRIRERLGGN